MDVNILNTSDIPIYQQLFQLISSQILKGELEPSYKLPPIRTAAKEMRVSIITVKKAWEELERQGFIYTMVGSGCFVAELSSQDILDKRQSLIAKKLKKDVKYYKELGLSLQEVVDSLKKVFNDEN